MSEYVLRRAVKKKELRSLSSCYSGMENCVYLIERTLTDVLPAATEVPALGLQHRMLWNVIGWKKHFVLLGGFSNFSNNHRAASEIHALWRCHLVTYVKRYRSLPAADTAQEETKTCSCKPRMMYKVYLSSGTNYTIFG